MKLKLKLNELEISRNSLMISERMLNDDILRLTNDIESSSLPNNDNSIKGYDIISVTSSLKDIEKDISDISNFKAASTDEIGALSFKIEQSLFS